MGWYTGLPKWAQIVLPVLVASVVALSAVLLMEDDNEAVAPTTTTTSTTLAPTTTVTPTTTTTTTTPTATSTPPPALTLETLSEQMAAEAPVSLGVPAWECQAFSGGPLTAGSIATCRPATLPTEGEYPEVTVLVLDDAGTHAAARSGIAHLLLDPRTYTAGGLADPVPPGQNCTSLLAADSPFATTARADQLTPEQTYFGVVLYYFLQDRTPLMDIDDNGIPCETLIESSVVDTVWSGGWIASRFD